MMNAPKTIEEFTNLKPWWKTPVSTRVVLSDDGVADLLRMLEDEGRRPFFVADKALAGQREFARIFAEKNLFAFDATFSEPRTGDVDALRALIPAKDQPLLAALLKHERKRTAQKTAGVSIGGGFDVGARRNGRETEPDAVHPRRRRPAQFAGRQRRHARNSVAKSRGFRGFRGGFDSKFDER